MREKLKMNVKRLKAFFIAATTPLYLAACTTATTMDGVETAVNAEVTKGWKFTIRLAGNFAWPIAVLLLIGGLVMILTDPDRKMKLGVASLILGGMSLAFSIYAINLK